MVLALLLCLSGEVDRIDVRSAPGDGPKLLQVTLSYYFRQGAKPAKYYVAAYVGSRFIFTHKPVEMSSNGTQGEASFTLENGTKNVQFGVYAEAVEKADCKRKRCEECEKWGRHLLTPVDTTSTMHLRDNMSFTIHKRVAKK